MKNYNLEQNSEERQREVIVVPNRSTIEKKMEK